MIEIVSIEEMCESGTDLLFLDLHIQYFDIFWSFIFQLLSEYALYFLQSIL